MRSAWQVLALAGSVVAGTGCSRPAPADRGAEGDAPAVAPTSSATLVELNPRMLRRFKPLPDGKAPPDPVEERRIDLGRRLFYDPRLSADGDLSCNGCHDLTAYGVDHAATSIGHRGRRGTRNAPTVYNAAGSFAQFWDGRAATVEDQALAPIVNPDEMALVSGAELVSRLRAVPDYVSAFAGAFPGEASPLSYANVGAAIGAFERGLVTPGRWDRYLRGEESALTPPEKEGLRTFLNAGCMVCHTGAYLGGSMFERVGAVEPWPNQTDQGRASVTGNPADAMMFKVPTLRNVAQTAPYFHDGSAATLPEAVRMMGRYQLGLELTDAEVGSIVTWLSALTGELPLAYAAPER